MHQFISLPTKHAQETSWAQIEIINNAINVIALHKALKFTALSKPTRPSAPVYLGLYLHAVTEARQQGSCHLHCKPAKAPEAPSWLSRVWSGVFCAPTAHDSGHQGPSSLWRTWPGLPPQSLPIGVGEDGGLRAPLVAHAAGNWGHFLLREV